jgi:hypothetical protein
MRCRRSRHPCKLFADRRARAPNSVVVALHEPQEGTARERKEQRDRKILKHLGAGLREKLP